MADLAINGGEPLLGDSDIRATWPVVGEQEVEAAGAVAASGNWWRKVEDSRVEAFEAEFAEYHDAGHCLAVANGTVALDVALRALGVGPGNEVIVPAMTFIASASAVLMARAVPVFADIDPETYQISAESVEQQVTERTRGIVVVHYAGYPVDMDAVGEVAQKHGLFVVEDAAHAQGTEWCGRRVGAIGDAGTFSFQQSKSLTAGEGGAVVTDRREVHERAYAYHHIGRALNAETYEHTIVGPNYRLGEFQGAMLRCQLGRLQQQTETKMRNAARLLERLEDVPGLVPLRPDERITQRGYYFLVLRYLQERMQGVHRDSFVEALKAENLPVSTGYGRPVYQTPAFAEASFGPKSCPLTCGHYSGEMDYGRVSLPAVENACANEQITIPQPYLMYEQNVRPFADAVHKVYERLGALN
ncbi:MAG: DegT/DnrJ/EryC1/StrS family aminotransferase [Planctomycetota bacterium]